MADGPDRETQARRRQNERKFDQFEERPAGGRIYTWNRKSPGADGGHSRITKIVNPAERTVEIIHEAWRGDQNPERDPPYHRHTKRVNP